jgi:hypothetical protein
MKIQGTQGRNLSRKRIHGSLKGESQTVFHLWLKHHSSSIFQMTQLELGHSSDLPSIPELIKYRNQALELTTQSSFHLHHHFPAFPPSPHKKKTHMADSCSAILPVSFQK